MTINELIEGCSKGRHKAQNILYEKYSARLYGVCRRYTENKTEAQDVLQDAMVKIYRSISKIDCSDEKPFYAWLHKVTVNTALNYLRDNQKYSRTLGIDEREDEPIDEIAEEDFSFYERLVEKVDVAMLLGFIQELPCGYRMVFNLYVIDNMSHKDIAQELGISVNTSKTQLFKAKKMLACKISASIGVSKIKMVI